MSSRVYLLAAGSFTVGSSAYVIAGVLPAISGELAVSASAVGQLVTVFAFAYAIGSPVLITLTARWERKALLLAALFLGFLGNGLAAVAPDYGLLVVARVVTALGGAVFLPVAAGVGTTLMPPERRGRALAVVYGGLALSLILWLPVASLLSGPLGYRGVFAVVAAMALLTAIGIQFGIPAVDAPPVVPLRARFASANTAGVRLVLAVTMLGALSAFGVFTYLAPLLAETGGLRGATVSLLLLVYGTGSVLGTVVGGIATDRFGSRGPLLVMFAVFTAVLGTLSLSAGTAFGAAVALFVWGMTTWSVNPPMQNWLLELAPSPAAGGLLLLVNTSALYLGIGLSGIFGGVVIATAGITALPPIAACVGLVALALLALAGRAPAAAARASEVDGAGRG